ncbi:hypothetical protein HMPREF1370_02163, partial [Enterococcus faecium P1123]
TQVNDKFLRLSSLFFFADKNHYHALDPNRNYHGTYKEDE